MKRPRVPRAPRPPAKRFEFDFDPRFTVVLGLLGAWPSNSGVDITPGGRLVIRLGPWAISTSLANVASSRITGPYKPVRAIGIRLSLVDRGLTFGTNARRGLCIQFRNPVRSYLRIAHPAVTVTVGDPEGLRSAIEHSQGPEQKGLLR